VALVAVLVVVGGALGAMAALGVVRFGDAGCPKAAVSATTTVTTTPSAGRQAQIRFPESLCGFPRNDAPGPAAPPLPMPLVFDSADYGTDAGHPALGLVVMGWPFDPKVDVVDTVIDQLEGVGDLARSTPKEQLPQGQEFAGPFFRASDFHTFEHGGVAYRCASVRQAKSGSRRGLCIFYDRRAQTLVMLHGLAPSVADAMRLSEIADQARRALSTI
jgi:hypothetical protein